MDVLGKVLRRLAVSLAALALPLSASAQGFIRDAEIESILREYSDPLFEAAGLKPSDVNIYVRQDPTLNAGVAGGQNMMIHTGLIMAAETPEQLKGVIAHETGHMAGGHNVTRRQALEASSGTSIITLGLGALALAAGAPDAAMALFGSAQQFQALTFFKFTRIEESAADQYGVSFMEKTGQSSEGLINFMEKFRYQELMSESRRDPYFRGHPVSTDRIAALRKRAAEASINAKPQTDRAIDQLAMMKAKLVGFIGPATRVMSTYPASDQSIYGKYARAIAAYRAVDIKASLKGTEELIALQPDNPYFYELKGQILYESGKAAESIEPHRRSVELAPDQALLKVNLARSLATITTQEGENLAEAEGLLVDALALERDNPYAWTFLADVYAKQKRIGDADWATAEAAYHLGDMSKAHVFASRAVKNLTPGTPNARRADDILLLSDPRGLRAQRGRRN